MTDNPEQPSGELSLSQLQLELASLSQRVAQLEAAHGQQAVAHSGQIATPGLNQTSLAQALPQAPASSRPVESPLFTGQTPGRPQQSLENRIGSQLFNRIGILAILIGAAWLLKFAIDQEWIGAAPRILIGLVSGSALYAWSERFRRSGIQVFSYSLKAIGSGILYLSLWAAFSLFHLLPAPVALLGMALVTAVNAWLSLRQNSELLAAYAMIGGFLTPGLLSTGQDHQIFLFSYILLLCCAVVALTMLRIWPRLLFGAFILSSIYGAGWAIEYYTPEKIAPTGIFLALYTLLFALAPFLVRIAQTEQPESVPAFLRQSHQSALVLVTVLNALFGYACFWQLLSEHGRVWFHPWLTLIFAAAYTLVAWLAPAARHQWCPRLRLCCAAIAVVFLTLFFPLQLSSERQIALSWLAEGLAVLAVGNYLRQRLLLTASAILLALAVFMLLASLGTPYSGVLVFNTRLLSLAVGMVGLWLAAGLFRRGQDFSKLPSLSLVCQVMVNVLALTAVGCEIHNYWFTPVPVSYEQRVSLSTGAQFSYSIWGMLYGAALMLMGFMLRKQLLRWQSLVLLALSIAKVFLYDMRSLSQGYRILSLLGLGILLLSVSLAYQKDWLNLRRQSLTDEV